MIDYRPKKHSLTKPQATTPSQRSYSDEVAEPDDAIDFDGFRLSPAEALRLAWIKTANGYYAVSPHIRTISPRG